MCSFPEGLFGGCLLCICPSDNPKVMHRGKKGERKKERGRKSSLFSILAQAPEGQKSAAF